MKNFSIKRPMSLMGMVCVMLLTACATHMNSADLVRERAMARWDALLSGDSAGAYEYLSPGYRSSVSSLQYQRSILLMRVRWTSADYIESDCKETVCNVKILLEFAVDGALPGVSSFEETGEIEESWVLVDGMWYLVPRE